MIFNLTVKFSLVSILSVEHCKFMDSKMRPLYLVFENLDELGDLVRIIFKNGDGKCGRFLNTSLCDLTLLDSTSIKVVYKELFRTMFATNNIW